MIQTEVVDFLEMIGLPIGICGLDLPQFMGLD
jgi:hypothetical protein